VIVTTKLGRLEGEELGKVTAFRGVPYAAPPTGELRFRAPAPPEPWTGTRDARRFGPTSPQLLSIMRDLEPQDEACLHLNVWTPALGPGHARGPLPVMVFVHGGAFVSGAATHPMYDGRELALRGDVVVVSFNYRLGALGFVDLGALGDGRFSADANNGLRDQVAALRWVREHIDAFGGDPEQVTVFGQSSGAMSLADLLTLDAASGLFVRAIAQSGAAHHVTTREHSAMIATRMLDALGLGPRDLEQLRALPVAAIVKAQAACQRCSIDVGARGRPLYNANMTLLPVVDGELIAEVPIDAAVRGAGANTPLLLGTNADEWNFWVFLTDVTKRDLDQAGLRHVIEMRLPARAREAVELYDELLGEQLGRPPEPWQVYCAIETDRIFTLPAARLAEARARAPAATFMYRFEWTGPLFEGLMGCCHTMEVPFVLGLTDDGFGRVFAGGGAEARALSERIMDAWIAFARCADPSTDALGEWPRYELLERTAIALRGEPGRVSTPHPARSRFWAELI
jgi:para-nitrobenzyl esterase